jgi:two-component system, chemotaxis family, protein-glutamate methylesterase/glutaminase
MPSGLHLVVIGGSAGAVTAMQLLLARLPSNLPAAVCVVLHLSPTKPSLLPDILQRVVALEVEAAEDGVALRPGHVYVAVPGHHLRVADRAVAVEAGAKQNGHRPSIDVLFQSAAQHAGDRVIGVVLSGMLDDGAAGAREIKARGGAVAVQDPDEAEYPDMPNHAMEAVNPDLVGGLEQIATWLVARIGDGDGARPGSGRGSRAGVTDEPVGPTPNGDLAVTCPECHGPVAVTEDGDLLRFACIVGHTWSETSFVHAHSGAVEAALWASVRVLEERANLYDRLATQSDQNDRRSARDTFTVRSTRAREQASVLRSLIAAAVDDLGEPALRPAAEPETPPARRTVRAAGDRGDAA